MRCALAQISSTYDPEENLRLVDAAMQKSAAQGARLVVFPEATMCAFGVDLAAIAEPEGGPWDIAFEAAAQRHGVVAIAGIFTPGIHDRVRNTLIVRGGGIKASYDKIHLYDAFGFKESDGVTPGALPVLVEVDGYKIGLATCYDVRFPALFTSLAQAGADLTVVCASWGDGPGKSEQWELATRARAMDSTTPVVAVDQAVPSDSREPGAPSGVGGSLAVSALGQILAQAGSGPDVLIVDVDPEATDSARRALPVLQNARSLGPEQVEPR